MTSEFRPILLEDFEIAWPGFALQRVALNQHMPRVERLSEHVHPFHQILVYLRGSGTQDLEGQLIPVERGSQILIPGGTRHRFVKSRHQRPVCLAIDFTTDLPGDWNCMSRAPRTALLHIERLLVELHAEESSRQKSSVHISSLILQIFSQVEAVARKDSSQSSYGPVSVSVNRVIDESEFASLTPGTVAKHLNRSLDHLNRQLREETGMSVGQTISRKRLDQAMKLLRNRALPIGDVASAVGIDDQNYFSRWFRQKAGQTPTRWRDAMQ